MLNDLDYQKAANALSLTVPHIKAFAEVESNGDGFLPTGEVKILFERHVFYKQLVANRGKAFADTVAKTDTDICNTTPGAYGKYSEQHPKLQRAVAIDRQSGLESCSWGAFQIMGYQWKTVGLTNAQEFVNLNYSDYGQLQCLVLFLKANSSIVTALRNKAWTTAAKLYNGPAQQGYDNRLSAAYTKFGGK